MTWKTLDQMRAEIEESKWFHSRILEEVEVAIAIGHLHDWEELPENTQALAIARFRVRGVREAYEDELNKRDRRKRDADKPKPASRGRRR